MAALLVFMFWSSRRRAARMKAEQEAKSRAMLPGVKVLLQGGLYGIATPEAYAHLRVPQPGEAAIFDDL